MFEYNKAPGMEKAWWLPGAQIDDEASFFTLDDFFSAH